jgi:hypothetical protein
MKDIKKVIEVAEDLGILIFSNIWRKVSNVRIMVELAAIFCLIAILVGSWMIAVHYSRQPAPAPQSFLIYLPPEAEVRPSKTVIPGTFKIEVTLEDFEKERINRGTKPIVTYPESPQDIPYSSDFGKDFAIVHYWLPRQDGVFYHTTQEIKDATKFVERWEWSKSVDGLQLTSYPSHGGGLNFFLPVLVMMAMAIFGTKIYKLIKIFCIDLKTV